MLWEIVSLTLFILAQIQKKIALNPVLSLIIKPSKHPPNSSDTEIATLAPYHGTVTLIKKSVSNYMLVPYHNRAGYQLILFSPVPLQ